MSRTAPASRPCTPRRKPAACAGRITRVLPAMPRCICVEIKPGCCFIQLASFSQALRNALGPNATQADICEVIQFLADKGAPLDEKNARGRTPMDVADILPIDKAVSLMTSLIIKSGAKPVHPSGR